MFGHSGHFVSAVHFKGAERLEKFEKRLTQSAGHVIMLWLSAICVFVCPFCAIKVQNRHGKAAGNAAAIPEGGEP